MKHCILRDTVSVETTRMTKYTSSIRIIQESTLDPLGQCSTWLKRHTYLPLPPSCLQHCLWRALLSKCASR